MTVTLQVRICQDDEVLLSEVINYDEEAEEALWLTALEWLVSKGRVARAAFYGPSPQPAPKLAREDWDPEYR